MQPNISDGYVSCTASATRHASLQIFFKSPAPANGFETATKHSFTFCLLLTRCRFIALPHRTTLRPRKMVRTCDVFQKWSEPKVFVAFSLRNVLRASMACPFKRLNWQKFYVLTSDCASCHSGAHFLNSSTSKCFWDQNV